MQIPKSPFVYTELTLYTIITSLPRSRGPSVPCVGLWGRISTMCTMCTMISTARRRHRPHHRPRIRHAAVRTDGGRALAGRRSVPGGRPRVRLRAALRRGRRGRRGSVLWQRKEGAYAALHAPLHEEECHVSKLALHSLLGEQSGS